MKTLFLRESDKDKLNMTFSERRLSYEEQIGASVMIMLPDDIDVAKNMLFNISIYNTSYKFRRSDMHTVIELMAIIKCDNMYCGDYINGENKIYNSRKVVTITIPFMQFISPKLSDEFTIVIFNSNISNYPMHMYSNDVGTYLTVNDMNFEIDDIVFDTVKIDNVNLLKEMKKLNVLTTDI